MSEESTGEATEKQAITPDADSLESTTVQTPVDTEVTTPSNDTADTAETVDMNDILSVPSTKEERGGLSRKEFKLQQEQEAKGEDRIEHLTKEVEELKSVLGNVKDNAEYLENTRKQTEQARIESMFHDTLKAKGVDAATFNAQYKAEFKAEQSDLVDSGLSIEKATEKALKITLASYQADAKVKDTEQRAEGRAKATLPASSTASPDKTVYTQSELQKLTQDDYNLVMDRIEAGKARISQ
jgi:hypothetical protein